MLNPIKQKEFCSFLGMVNYYDRFITPGLTSKCANLNDLLHKETVWQWDKHHAASVHEIKTAFTSTGALALYDPISIYPVMLTLLALVLSLSTPFLTIQKR